MTNQSEQQVGDRAPLPWGLIAALGSSILIIPALTLLGVFDRAGWQPVVLLLIAVGWVAVAVRARLQRPVATLAAAGAAYGLIALFLRLLLPGVVAGLGPGPVPFIGHLVAMGTYAGYGAILGLIASAILGGQSSRH